MTPMILPTLPNDAVPVDIQKQSESILFQFTITNEKSSPVQPIDDTGDRGCYNIL
jgi:hypothetical protein